MSNLFLIISLILKHLFFQKLSGNLSFKNEKKNFFRKSAAAGGCALVWFVSGQNFQVLA